MEPLLRFEAWLEIISPSLEIWTGPAFGELLCEHLESQLNQIRHESITKWNPKWNSKLAWCFGVILERYVKSLQFASSQRSLELVDSMLDRHLHQSLSHKSAENWENIHCCNELPMSFTCQVKLFMRQNYISGETKKHGNLISCCQPTIMKNSAVANFLQPTSLLTVHCWILLVAC